MRVWEAIARGVAMEIEAPTGIEGADRAALRTEEESILSLKSDEKVFVCAILINGLTLKSYLSSSFRLRNRLEAGGKLVRARDRVSLLGIYGKFGTELAVQ